MVGFILSVDSFSAAMAMGYKPFKRKDALTFALISGGSEALVAMIGALAGSQIVSYFSSIDHWIAFSLLSLVALHMAYEGIKELLFPSKKEEEFKFHSLIKILLVSLATSLDAFGIGIGLGLSGKTLWPYIISIGFWAFFATIIGLYLARRLSRHFGPIMNLFGSVILIIMAFQMLSI